MAYESIQYLSCGLAYEYTKVRGDHKLNLQFVMTVPGSARGLARAGDTSFIY